MEGFDLISTGAWSIIPPLLALGLALITKEVYSSLIIGVFAGTIIYAFTLSGVGIEQFISAFAMVPQIMAAQIADNGALLLFLALLGALVMIIARAGGSRAYGEWVSSHIKSSRAALVLTSLLGIIIFVDDYFNCLTVGAVMRPVTDRFKICHEKLAWIIDSTAAPVCIIAPVSSWAVAVGGYLGDDGFNTFVASIPYNFYALFTIFFVFFMCILNRDYGPMLKAQREYEVQQKAEEKNAQADKASSESSLNVESSLEMTGASATEFSSSKKMAQMLSDDAERGHGAEQAAEEFRGLSYEHKGTTLDLVIPILVLIASSIAGMLYTGGFFEGASFAEAIGEDPVAGLCIGVSLALVVTAFMVLPRRLLGLKPFMDGLADGVRSMVGAVLILVLAWSLSSVCRYMLGTGQFVSAFLGSIGVDLAWLPVFIFVIAGFVSFSMGTSWGTIALILPIVIGIYETGDPLFLVAIGAALGGAVFGDHVSPISDTTILSSTGASCNHLRHVTTQLAYASVVASVCVVCYIVVSLTDNIVIGLCLGMVLIVAVVLCLLRSPLGAEPLVKKGDGAK
ncbi:MAG: sodium:proton antiporter [Eggerthellaceae bacterium]|jgi:Na+/H+ antiporter NhaC|nr:sodium:proton antiporter [Eggerthellaceae bacterium]